MSLQKNLTAFSCQESCGGKCCTGDENSFVFLTQADRKRISFFTRLNVSEFATLRSFDQTRFTNKPSRQWALTMQKGHCQFFKNGKCGIYEMRPTQCRTFPYWPENMQSENWEKLKEYCPGVGKGGGISRAHLLKEQLEADRELAP